MTGSSEQLLGTRAEGGGPLPPAVVIGLDDLRGVHAARTLARHRVPIIGIARDPQAYGCKTKACQQLCIGETRTPELISVLETIGSRLEGPAVLVPCSDMAALQVSRYREELDARFCVTLPDPEVVETMMDKVAFYRFAAEVGLPIPRTVFLSNPEDVERAADVLRFPCAIKPPNSKDPGWLAHTNVKAYQCRDVDELRKTFELWRAWADPLVAQEWIFGPDENLFACHGYFGPDSEPLVTFTSRKLRQWPPRTGQACLAQECRNDKVVALTLELFRQTGFRGLGYVEVKRDERTGEYFIVEPNIGRVSGRMAIAEAGGVELLFTMYCDALGLPLPAARTQTYADAKWIALRQDLQSSLLCAWRRELTVRQWWSTVRGRKQFALWSWRDPGPFLSDFIQGFLQLTTRNERRRRFANPVRQDTSNVSYPSSPDVVVPK